MIKKISVLMLTLLAATVARAEVGVVEVGDFEGATTMVEGSYFDSAPTTFYLAHTGSQIIYTAQDLAGLAGKDDVKITAFTFRFANMGGYYDITRAVRVYVQMTDQTAFATIEGVKQFFDFDETQPAMAAEVTYELADTYGDDGLLTLTLDQPVDYIAGNGIILTVVMDALDDDNCLDSGFDLQFYNAGTRSRAMTFTNNHVSFLDYKETEDFPDASSVLGCGTNIDLPVTRIAYSYADAGIKGDVTGDGVVDVADINAIINVMLGKATNAAADVNGDGLCDVMDINLTTNAMIGK